MTDLTTLLFGALVGTLAAVSCFRFWIDDPEAAWRTMALAVVAALGYMILQIGRAIGSPGG